MHFTLTFSKNVLNKNFEKIIQVLKSIQKSLEIHEFLNVPCNISRNLSDIISEKSTLFKN